MVTSSGNPIIDELDNLSPPAKAALTQVHQSLTPPPTTAATLTPPVNPGPTQPAPAPLIPTPPSQAALPPPTTGANLTAPLSQIPAQPQAQPGLTQQSPQQSATPSIMAPQPRPNAVPLTPTPDMQAHSDELSRLQSSPSGVAGIKNPWARIPLQIADAVGGSFFPGIERALPGTEGHHLALIEQAKANQATDQGILNEEQKRGLEAGQTNAQNAMPDYRFGTVTNNANKNQNTLELGQEKNAITSQKIKDDYNKSLMKDGYRVNEETGEAEPIPFEELSEKAQSDSQMKRAHADELDALKEYQQARAAGEPTRLAQATQRLGISQQNANIASQNAQRAADKWSVQKTGIDSSGNIPVAQALLPGTNTPVGTTNAKNVLPTSTERNKGDLANSADHQLDVMEGILDKHKNDWFAGPMAGRANAIKTAIGNQDPDVAAYNSAHTYLTEHGMAMFGGRGRYLYDPSSALTSLNLNPDALRAAIHEARGTTAVFKDAGTPNVYHPPTGPTNSIQMQAPDGTKSWVNKSDVKHYKQLGAKVVE